jgi:hypothetical protein
MLGKIMSYLPGSLKTHFTGTNINNDNENHIHVLRSLEGQYIYPSLRGAN